MKLRIFILNICLVSICFLSSSGCGNINQSKTTDIVFVVDVSLSMLADDIEPNRLELVKSLLKKLVNEKNRRQRFSIILFAKDAIILCPLTNEKKKLLNEIEQIEVGKLQNGTSIYTGLMFGIFELISSESEKKNIMLFSDGALNLEEYSLDLLDQLTANQKIRVHSFGVGCKDAATYPMTKTSEGEYIFVRQQAEVDEEKLKSIAGKLGGNYSKLDCHADIYFLDHFEFMINTVREFTIPASDTIDNHSLDAIWTDINDRNEQSLKQFKIAEKLKKYKPQEY